MRCGTDLCRQHGLNKILGALSRGAPCTIGHRTVVGVKCGEFQLLGDSGRERFCLIRTLPSEVFANAAEVTVGSSLLINGALEIQHRD